MIRILALAGDLAGGLGLLLCAASAIVRLSGVQELAGHDVLTFFVVGMALMLTACLAKIEVLVRR